VPAEIIQRQRIVGDLFANAIMRAHSELALREGERRLNLAAAAAKLGLWRWNVQDNSMWATDRAKRIFGFSPETEVTFGMWRERVHMDDQAAVEAALAEAVARNGSYETEYRAVGDNGEVRWIAASGQAASGAGGEPISMTGVVMDITERRNAEREMQELRRDLAHAGRVTLLGQLASALAHELGQPLGAILRNAEAADLILQEEPPDLEELRAIVTDIRRDDQRAGDVISRLRSLLKKRELELQHIGIEVVIAEVVALVRGDAAERGVKVEVAAAPNLPDVRGDRVHLQQVLLNLIINAMDALRESKAGDHRISIRAAGTADGQVVVSVSDNGPGIAEDKLGKVFEPFFTTKSTGMGVGLAVTQNLIEAHRGKIWAENRPEGGAVFHFTVPGVTGGGAA
jgi:PAS domain S-box-containing protein